MSTAASPGQFKLRLPEELHDQIKAAAAVSGTSANGEIIHRLLSYEGTTLTVRLSAETREKLDRIAAKGPYRITITSIVERGIELAAQELERLK